MNDPDMVLLVDPDADRHAEQPAWNGFGQNGSTSNTGPWTVERCASALFCSTAWPTPSAAMAPTRVKP